MRRQNKHDLPRLNKMRLLQFGLTFMTFIGLISVLAFEGCDARKEGNNMQSVPLEKIVVDLYVNVDVPPYEIVALNSDNFQYYSFIPHNDSLSAVSADALASITPHSLVVIRTENGDGEALAQEIFNNADPGKWLCVRAESVSVAYTDHYVILVMSERITADAITENFGALAQELDGMNMKLYSADNPEYEQ